MKKIISITFLLLLVAICSDTFGAMIPKEARLNSGNKIQNYGEDPKAIPEEKLRDLLDETGKPLFDKKHVRDSLETDVMNERILSGYNEFDNFGKSVSDAGDINGDGFDDIIVGEPINNIVSADTGKVYIYFGGLMFNSVPDVILSGEQSGDWFGVSVSSAGDVNGDSYPDVIVGAPYYNSLTGRAYIFFGGAVVNNTADVILQGEAQNNLFGFSVSSAGNINGDGFSDVIAGAMGHNSNTGRAYIYYGGSVMNNIADLTLTGTSGSLFGYSVSGAGDANGDGFSDVIIGSPVYSSNTGRVYVYYGAAGMNNTADVIMTGEGTSSYFGISVSTAGDINGDGYSDVISGANGHNTERGRAYIFDGGTSMNSVADIKISGEATGDNFGESVSNAGDINGDGYDDIMIGAQYHSIAGRTYIYKGHITMDTLCDKILSGEGSGDGFGASVSSAGDINGDGIPDVVIGAPHNDINGLDAGRAYVYAVSAIGNDVEDLQFTGETTGNYFGASVSFAGDVNGDGFPDIIIGAPRYNSVDGRAYIFLGGPGMDNNPDVTFISQSAGSQLGNSVSAAGDVNGDGFSDVIVGAYRFYPSLGRAYIYFGGSDMNNVADVILHGETSTEFAYTVSNAGDVNGDGYSDVMVGSRGHNSYTGKAQLYLGGASMNNVADVIFLGEGFDNYFGKPATTAGDVNGDGYSDIIVGADGYGSDMGRAYIYFGGISMNNVADVIMTGEAMNNFFGTSVSAAGDVNGDGYSDVIVGANGYNSTGRAYIYFGGVGMNNVADIIMTGETTNNHFGWSVSGAGDINGDGISDVIVGAIRYVGLTGRSYILYGGQPMNNVSDVTMTGEATNNFFGVSVSTAGDVNDDGLSDVIVAAEGYGNNTGRVYLFMSTSPNVNNGVGTINLTTIIEGFYDALLNNMRMSDTLRIYLRNSSSPYAAVDSAKTVINSATFTGSFQIHNAPSGSYYIQTKHRNTIETWTAAGIAYSQGATVSYNFTTSSSQAFGNNMRLVDASPVRFAIYSGDVNHDGVVDATDAGAIDNDAFNFVTGYVNTDLTGNNFVDASDAAIVDNNAANFVVKITP